MFHCFEIASAEPLPPCKVLSEAVRGSVISGRPALLAELQQVVLIEEKSVRIHSDVTDCSSVLMDDKLSLKAAGSSDWKSEEASLGKGITARRGCRIQRRPLRKCCQLLKAFRICRRMLLNGLVKKESEKSVPRVRFYEGAAGALKNVTYMSKQNKRIPKMCPCSLGEVTL